MQGHPSSRRHSLVTHVKGRMRLIGGAAIGVVAYAFLSLWDLGASLRLALSWDLGIAVYLMASWGMMWRSTREVMERRAQDFDITLAEIVGLTVAAAAFSLIAAARVLGAAEDQPQPGAALYIVAGIGTIILSWCFIHTLFAIHYAHEFHDRDRGAGGKARGGLKFPGESRPDYWDFVYFAAIIAMTCQVSDVAIESRAMRHLATAHGLISFIVNTVIVALAVGIAASLI